MRIALLNTLYPPTIAGGAQKTVQTIAESLVQDGHEVHVIALATQGAGCRYTCNGVQVVKLEISNIYNPYRGDVITRRASPLRAAWHLRDSWNLTARDQVMQRLEEIEPEILTLHCIAGFSGSMYSVGRLLDVPSIAFLHDYYALCVRSLMFDRRSMKSCPGQCAQCRLLRSSTKSASQLVDAVVGVSHFILNRHLEFGYFRNATPVALHNSYTAPEVPVRKSRQPVAVFGYLGTILPEKGVENLITAVAGVNEPIELRIFGSGESKYVDRLKMRSSGLPIAWRGVLPAEKAMTELDALIVPSLWDEPFGRVVVEAMASGVPVISAKSGGIPEIVEGIKPDLSFEPGDHEELSRILNLFARMSEAEYVQLRQASLSRARQFESAGLSARLRSIFEAARLRYAEKSSPI